MLFLFVLVTSLYVHLVAEMWPAMLCYLFLWHMWATVFCCQQWLLMYASKFIYLTAISHVNESEALEVATMWSGVEIC